MEYILDLLKKLKKDKRLSKEIHNEIDFAINDLEKDLEEDEIIACEKCGSLDTVVACFGEDDRFKCHSCGHSYSLE